MATDWSEAEGVKVLASGRLVEVDPTTRKATPVRCSWLIQVASGNPEPDFPEDCFVIEECGVPLRAITDGWACDGGHVHHFYGSHTQQVAERAEALVEHSASLFGEVR